MKSISKHLFIWMLVSGFLFLLCSIPVVFPFHFTGVKSEAFCGTFGFCFFALAIFYFMALLDENSKKLPSLYEEARQQNIQLRTENQQQHEDIVRLNKSLDAARARISVLEAEI